MKERAKEQKEQLKALLQEKKVWETPQGASTPSRNLPSDDQDMDTHQPSPIRAPTPSPPPQPMPQRPNMRRKAMKDRLGVESNVRDRIDESRKSHPSGDSGVSESSYTDHDRYNSCTALVPLSTQNDDSHLMNVSTNSFSVAKEGKITDVTQEMESDNPPPSSDKDDKDGNAEKVVASSVDKSVEEVVICEPDKIGFDDCGTEEKGPIGEKGKPKAAKKATKKPHPKCNLDIIRELSADVLQIDAVQDQEFVDAGKEGGENGAGKGSENSEYGPLTYAEIMRNAKNAEKNKSANKGANSKPAQPKKGSMDKSLDDFVWTREAVHDFLRDSMPRPDKYVKPFYLFSLIDKLDKSMVKEGKIECDGCKKLVDFYGFGDTIKVLLTTSTLAGMKYRDSDRFRKHECAHFEYLQIRGGTFLDMERVARPMLKFLQGYFNLEVLIVCGINELNEKGLEYHQIIDRVRLFNVKMTSRLLQPKHRISGVGVVKPGFLNLRFMGIPFPPAFTRLGTEAHPIKEDINRTDDVANLNRYYRGLNKAAGQAINSSRQIPTLQYLGITGGKFTEKPTNNTHNYSAWYHKDKDYPNVSLRMTREVVHLRDTVKLVAWKAVHTYFNKV